MVQDALPWCFCWLWILFRVVTVGCLCSGAAESVHKGTARSYSPPAATAAAAAETYIYNYIADSPGTFWVHSHFRDQYPDGLRTPLIIRDPFATLYPAEPVLTVSDWYNVTGWEVTQEAIKFVGYPSARLQ